MPWFRIKASSTNLTHDNYRHGMRLIVSSFKKTSVPFSTAGPSARGFKQGGTGRVKNT